MGREKLFPQTTNLVDAARRGDPAALETAQGLAQSRVLEEQNRFRKLPLDKETKDSATGEKLKILNDLQNKEAELMEILWRRGNDNLNIALHKGIEKLYRMLRGDRLHPPRERGNRGRKNRVRKHD